MKWLTATNLIFVHAAIQCQRRKLPEIINSREGLTSSVRISVEKAYGTVLGTFKNKLNSGWQCKRLKLIPLLVFYQNDLGGINFRNGDHCCKGNEINRSSSWYAVTRIVLSIFQMEEIARMVSIHKVFMDTGDVYKKSSHNSKKKLWPWNVGWLSIIQL